MIPEGVLNAILTMAASGMEADAIATSFLQLELSTVERALGIAAADANADALASGDADATTAATGTVAAVPGLPLVFFDARRKVQLLGHDASSHAFGDVSGGTRLVLSGANFAPLGIDLQVWKPRGFAMRRPVEGPAEGLRMAF